MTKDKLDICTMCHIQLDELREACSMFGYQTPHVSVLNEITGNFFFSIKEFTRIIWKLAAHIAVMTYGEWDETEIAEVYDNLICYGIVRMHVSL